ncbi:MULTISPECIES: tRNA dihydrouridine(20/20a) synthase DusA [Prochlorococcus]|uniref:tRNA dihydrouridine(20/20a) synthase DusA n=1 Tax=Prochlorococcus TaxID=1218 RepID=UPI0005339EB4|nr:MULTISPECIES: tRNA dihydrouridine(20/20a) synthase DusA [Prochlorococcus]KGG13378.1 tRNA dihydrouridine synthase A [Prochlorococcus sp. MIT 0601]
MVAKSREVIYQPYRFSIAPMLDCTDRHFRVIFRHISKRALLYTEMIVAKALLHQKGSSLLDFNEIEHPISLQIGGDDPKELAEAAKIAEIWGYDEINLNVGCPSSKVKAGKFGACLMAHPTQVAKCIEAMKSATNLPVTIKHRTGIDYLDSDESLLKFVDEIASAGADRFAIHARKAWLSGLNPKQNRTIPPLEYEKVGRIKEKRPELKIELNGGLKTPINCLNALQKFDGAMVGRAAYSNPMLWKEIDALIFGDKIIEKKQSEIIKALIPYAEAHLNQDGRMWDICKHILQLVQGIPGARAWRREVTANGQKANADLSVLKSAALQLEKKGF